MSPTFTRSLAAFAAVVLTLTSVGMITAVPPAYASPIAAIVA